MFHWSYNVLGNRTETQRTESPREAQRQRNSKTESSTNSFSDTFSSSTPHAATTLHATRSYNSRAPHSPRSTSSLLHRRCNPPHTHTHTALPQLLRPTFSPTSPPTPTHHSPARASLPLTSNKHDRGKPDRCETSPAHLTSIALCSRAPDAVAWRCTPWPRPHGQGGLTNGSAATFEVELRATSPTCTSTARGKTAWARARPRARPRARAPSPPSAA